jgi:hypothetical protein
MRPYEIGAGQLEKKLHNFYQSSEWKQLKNKFLEASEKVCVVCGLRHSLHVDHIKPIRHYWESRLDNNNLQVMCGTCNKEKGSKMYWTLEEHRRFKRVKELEKEISDLRYKRTSMLNNLSEEWRGITPPKPQVIESIPKPKTEILRENGKRVFRVRNLQEKISIP